MIRNETSKISKISLVVCYFGPFPNYFNLWLKSCKDNPTVDFKVFTDQEKPSDCPSNVEFINTTLKDLKSLFEKKLGFSISLDKPYKLCDFKPAYGLLLNDYLANYDFWGHCDIDLIFGDIRGFIDEEVLRKFDRILTLGHFSLYRNCKEMNELFMKSGSRYGYKHIFRSTESFAFDETVGMNLICKYNNIPVYNKNCVADIDVRFRRFRLRNDIHDIKYQVFYWEKGQLFRVSMRNGSISTDKFMYIHLQKRTFKETLYSKDINAFFISENGFQEKVVDSIISRNVLETSYKGQFQDLFDKTKYYIGKLMRFLFSDMKTKKRIIEYRQDLRL